MSRRSIIPTMEDFGFGLEGGKALMSHIGDLVVAEWGAAARSKGKLNSTLAPYVQSIHILEVTKTSVTVELPGGAAKPKAALLARMIEFGMGPGGIGTSGPYQLRKYLLTGDKARKGRRGQPAHKDGDRAGSPIVNVMFRHVAGGSTSTPSSHMGSSVAKAASRLAATTTRGNRTAYGGRLNRSKAKPGRNKTTGTAHAVNKLHGMVRMSGKGSKAGGSSTSGFRTWRRATLSQSKGKWVHPGIRPRRLAEHVQGRLGELIDMALADHMGGTK